MTNKKKKKRLDTVGDAERGDVSIKFGPLNDDGKGDGKNEPSDHQQSPLADFLFGDKGSITEDDVMDSLLDEEAAIYCPFNRHEICFSACALYNSSINGCCVASFATYGIAVLENVYRQQIYIESLQDRESKRSQFTGWENATTH